MPGLSLLKTRQHSCRCECHSLKGSWHASMLSKACYQNGPATKCQKMPLVNERVLRSNKKVQYPPRFNDADPDDMVTRAAKGMT